MREVRKLWKQRGLDKFLEDKEIWRKIFPLREGDKVRFRKPLAWVTNHWRYGKVVATTEFGFYLVEVKEGKNPRLSRRVFIDVNEGDEIEKVKEKKDWKLLSFGERSLVGK